MKKIVIRQITLLNFKGVRNLTVDFNEQETNIYGANAAGKTTIFDAFTWVMFGKDSHDRKDFSIKTLDENNKAIERIPHEVSVRLQVNGEEINLKKCYVENWTKRRGQLEETFSGHSVECYYNDVPCTVTEYGKKIADICDEQLFKLIANPRYFTLQKKDYQRNMLFKMAGNVSSADVVNAHPEFAEFVKVLSGKTLEELKREVAAKKRKIKDSIESIPARIDECKRAIPEASDWEWLENRIQNLEKGVAEVDDAIADRSKAYNDITKHKQDIAKQLSEVTSRITAREMELKQTLLADYNNALSEHNNSVAAEEKLRSECKFLAVTKPRLKSELNELVIKREALIAEWKGIKSEVFTYDQSAMICPTCKRPLDANEIEEKVEEMRIAFNADHAKRLERNTTIGKETKAQMQAKQEELDALDLKLMNINSSIEVIKASKPYNDNPQAPDVAPVLQADEQLIELRNKQTDLRSQLDEEVQAPDVSELQNKRRLLEDEIHKNKLLLADRDFIEKYNNRIAELETEYKESQCALTDLEGTEYTISQFSKARIEQIEGRINNMFKMVKWKMYETQINGGEVETCEATVKGVPYSDLNKADKINAGLDIIDGICRVNGISAPIFIDNRESVSNIAPMVSQIINLIVDASCTTLKIQ